MKIFAFFLLMFSAAAFSQQLNTTSPPNVRFITSQPGALDEWPCFSPDGKSVLFSRSEDKGKTWIFYIAPTAGGEATRFIRSRRRANKLYFLLGSRMVKLELALQLLTALP
jgi:dipeptidyl aminopeptidase/acylaminoacyl peptidase